MHKEVIGNATLYCGDCRDIELPDGAIISDPPYGMDWNTDFTRFTAGNSRRGIGTKHKRIINDKTAFDPLPFLEFKEVILFGANHFWNFLMFGYGFPVKGDAAEQMDWILQFIKSIQRNALEAAAQIIGNIECLDDLGNRRYPEIEIRNLMGEDQ